MKQITQWKYFMICSEVCVSDINGVVGGVVDRVVDDEFYGGVTTILMALAVGFDGGFIGDFW